MRKANYYLGLFHKKVHNGMYIILLQTAYIYLLYLFPLFLIFYVLTGSPAANCNSDRDIISFQHVHFSELVFDSGVCLLLSLQKKAPNYAKIESMLEPTGIAKELPILTVAK